MTAHTEDLVLVPRAELDALRAENRRLRREAGDREALKRIRSDSGGGRPFTREELAEAWELVSDRVLRFPDREGWLAEWQVPKFRALAALNSLLARKICAAPRW
jgi:hypothetical protein